MANFEIAIAKTLPHEGGYVSAATAAQIKDSGGETYMGIARNYNPDWEGWPIIDAYKAKNGVPKWNFFFPEELGLTALVKARAKKNYWDAIKGDQIANQELANLLFEMFWGSGYLGIKQAQKSINKVIPAPVSVDGIIGNDTLQAINSAPQAQLYSQVYDDRKTWYENYSNQKLSSVWLKRLSDYPSQISEQIAQASETVKTTIKENPTLTIIALLFFLSSSALLYYQFFFAKQVE